MSPSNQLSCHVHSSLSHSQHQQVRTMSLFQPPMVYRLANLSQIIQYCHCSCLDNISSSPNLYLATACCPGRTIPGEEDFCSWRCFARRSRYCPQKPARSQVPLAVIATSVVFVYFIASLWCSFLLLRA